MLLRRVVSITVLALIVGLTGACASRNDPAVQEARAARATRLADELNALAPNVDARDLEWLDTARNRAVPVRIYVPRALDQASASAQKLPAIIFSHGLGSSRFAFGNLGRYWASQGIVSVHLQHIGSDRGVWGSSGWSLLNTLQAAASLEQALTRVEDVRFALDEVSRDSELARLVDSQRIAVGGHSFGANTALMAAGARFKIDGTIKQFGDARIKGAIIMSPPSLPREHDPIFVYTGIAIPTLHLTGTADHTPIPGFVTNAPERRVPFDSMATSPRYLGIFEQGRHSMFNDWSSDSVSIEIKASTRRLTLAFLRATLASDSGSAQLLRELPGVAHPLAVWEAR